MIGVSADDQATADRFRDALQLPYPLVGDPRGAILEAWGVRIPLLGVARRATFAAEVARRDLRLRRVDAPAPCFSARPGHRRRTCAGAGNRGKLWTFLAGAFSALR